MHDGIEAILAQIKQLERELLRAVQVKEREFEYRIHGRRVRFGREVVARHRLLVKRLDNYVRDSTFLVLLTAPLIWACLLPIALLDLFASVYQFVCFPIYGIPKVRRSAWVQFDRHRLAYLNVGEKLNCFYCEYANGVLSYMTELAARTEQYWCPIKHALGIRSAHSRYARFFEYGDAESYRRALEQVRRDFSDLEDDPA
jgi:hypothetical protein